MANSRLRYIIATIISISLQWGTLIGVSIFAYLFGNWWILFGILFVFIGGLLSNIKMKYPVLILVLVAYFTYVNKESFDARRLIDFFFLCFMYGFILNIFYKIIGFGDKLSRAMIAAAGNSGARAEIEKEVEEGMQKWKAEKESKNSK